MLLKMFRNNVHKFLKISEGPHNGGTFNRYRGLTSLMQAQRGSIPKVKGHCPQSPDSDYDDKFM